MAERVVTPPAGPFRGSTGVPGDKSLSHRALLLAAMAEGRSEIRGLGPGLDVAATRDAAVALGSRWDDGRLVSPGVERWTGPDGDIDCANSGTTMRLLMGAVAARPYPVRLVGDGSLSRRPMERVARPLRLLGAGVDLTPDGTAPVTVTGGPLHGTAVTIDLASAQVRSAFELAAVQAEGESSITGPPGFRDHTERMLESFGLGERLGRSAFRVVPGRIPEASYPIPGDPSSAAFLWASAAVLAGAEVTTRRISLNPGRLGFLQVLELMGAHVEAAVTEEFHGDAVGNVTVTGGELSAVAVGGDEVAAMIDELPLLAVVAAHADGVTTVTGAEELRAKESDRIATTVAMIRSLGGGAEDTGDGFAVVGTGWLAGGTADSHGDHRIAMAAAVAATAATGPVTVLTAEAASVSWPGFYDDLEALWSSR